MKSYFLGLVVAVALSAIYVTYNTAEVTINYLGFQASFNQGIWDVFVFGAGVIIMWVLSICASIEIYTANKKQTRELNKKIEDLENEKKSLLSALQNIGQPKSAHGEIIVIPESGQVARAGEVVMPPQVVSTESADERRILEQIAPEETTETDAAHKETKSENNRPSALKVLLASIFKKDKKTESVAIDVEKAETDEKTEADEKTEIFDEPESEENAVVCEEIEADEEIETETIAAVDKAEREDSVETTDTAETCCELEADWKTEIDDEPQPDDDAEISEETKAEEEIEVEDDAGAGEKVETD